MALHVLPILKALAPLIANAGGIVAGLRANSGARTEDRVNKLEQETIRAGEVLKGIAEQLQAIAQELRAQAEAAERAQKSARVALVVAVVACGGTLAMAMILALNN